MNRFWPHFELHDSSNRLKLEGLSKAHVPNLRQLSLFKKIVGVFIKVLAPF